jgi:hypothetical protein
VQQKILLFCFVYVSILSPQDEIGGRIIRFDIPYDKFVRAYFGCPPAGYFESSDCITSRRETDYTSFTKACHAAADLFKLKDTCEDGDK